jgi:phosphatidylserine decarboxylase
MVEIAASVIGAIDQCYSERAYIAPRPLRVGMFVARGAAKSRYGAGSSSDVLLFQKGSIRWTRERQRADARDLDQRGPAEGETPAETDVQVREPIARRA